MSIKIENSQKAFQTQLGKLEKTLKNPSENQKQSIYQRIFSLVNSQKPSNNLQTKDIANTLFNYCKANEGYLTEELVDRINSSVLEPLKQTSKQSRACVTKISSNLKTLIPTTFTKTYRWPANLDEIGLTKTQQTNLKTILSEAIPLISSKGHSYTLTKTKQRGKESTRKLTIKSHETVVKEYKLPITIDFIKKDGIYHTVLMGKKILGQGAERGKVRLCYDLTEGAYLVRKKITTLTEKRLLKHFQKHPTRGIISFFGERTSISKKDKLQILEYRYDETLKDALKKPISLPDRLSLIHNLLSGLDALHDVTMEDLSFKKITVKKIKGFHHDIKPNNILIRKDPATKQIEAALTDFGFACNPTFFGGTPGFKSPEELSDSAVILKKPSKVALKETIDYNSKFGQHKDIWSMGLVFATILAGHASTKVLSDEGDPPIACIEKRLAKGLKEGKKDIDVDISNLKQKDLNKDLEALKKKSLSSIKGPQTSKLKSVWDEVVFKMLQVDPKKRSSAKDVFKKFNAIIKNKLTKINN